MRKEIEADIETAKTLYPEIAKIIREYVELVNNNGDEDRIGYLKLENQIQKITGKSIKYNLWEIWNDGKYKPGKNMLKNEELKNAWSLWIECGINIFSYNIALPEPKIYNDLTKEDLYEIIREIQNDLYFEFKVCMDSYYKKLLTINFKNDEKYDLDIIKYKNEKYVEQHIEDIIENILIK